MALYSFFAKSLKGEEKTGAIEAKSVQQLAAILKEQGFLLIRAEPKTEKGKKKAINLPFLNRGVSLTEKLMFTRNLQVMITSGLSLPKALRILSEQSKSKKFKQVLSKIEDNITKGKNFSDSLEEFPEVFSELFRNMIKIGEETGELDNILKILSRQIEKEHDLKSKIQGALIYPAVIIFTMIGIGILMLIMVVPTLAKTFEELKIELPITTRIVIGLGNFLANNWLFCIIGFFVVVFLFGTIIKTKRGKKTADYIVLKIPIISTLVKKTNSAYTVRTLSSLIASGVPIVRSLEIVSGTLDNVYYKTAILDAAEKVRKGEKLSVSLSPYTKIYPSLVLQMMEVGEETGETSSILAKLADFFEEDIANETKNLASVIEPFLMLIIGVVIGFFAVSMVQPMYSMLDAI
ncbi:MAG: type II secretion system F family protein [Candidatus Nealsonbacteria bacterium]|nr:type II secretion system F family protein [Candidatus Nealsonbacteria bacterium]